ncbi:hypothetical protein ACSBR1_026026 [Camellia fascicularis]
MVALVADFGIAKILAQKKTTTQTKTLGTLDYIAPGMPHTFAQFFLPKLFSHSVKLKQTVLLAYSK